MLFQRRIYLSIILFLHCTAAWAQSESESIGGHAQLDPVDGAASSASFRNEAVSDDTSELEAGV